MSDEVTVALVPPLHATDLSVLYWTADGQMTRGAGQADDRLVLLLPASECTVSWVNIDAATPRQAAAAARAQTLAVAIDAEVHVVAEPADGLIAVATVSHAVMRHWLGWAEQHGRTVASMMPAALLLPAPAPGTLSVANLAGQKMARNETRAFVMESGMEDILTGSAVQIPVDAGPAIADLLGTPRLNLLNGPYAPPRQQWFNRERLKAVAALVALILLISLVIGLARLVRLHADIARIDGETAALASTALGRGITAESATSELDARISAVGVSRGSANAALAALMQAMEAQGAVGIDAASWDRSGTLTVTLGATRADEINPVLLALQNAGYRVTAQPRQGTDGRALGDITIRSEP